MLFCLMQNTLLCLLLVVGTTHFPPCIRAMVTDSDKLRVGDLHIITCTGVTIGSDTKENHGVVIQDTGVSRVRCECVLKTECLCLCPGTSGR